MNRFLAFCIDDQGQDITEYSLLLAFVCLASAAIFLVAGGSFVGIWSASNSTVSRANIVAS